ncbi:MAG: hypothetical protein ABII10_00745 [Candidatus Paceibacterota bacterium]
MAVPKGVGYDNFMLTTDISSSSFTAKLSYWFHRVMVWALALQTLWATWQSIKLIFIQIPESEVKLAANQFTQSDVNFLINDAILVIFAALISFLLATNFAKAKNQTSQNFQIIIGVIVTILNTWLWNYLNSQDPSILVQPLIDLLI